VFVLGVSHSRFTAAGDGLGDVVGAEVQGRLMRVVGFAPQRELIGGGLAAERPGEDVVKLESGGGAASSTIGGFEGAAVAIALAHSSRRGLERS